jgi:hypothetical protein
MQCVWAPVEHEAHAEYMLIILRPCGHAPGSGDGEGNKFPYPGSEKAPSCLEHTAEKRASPVAKRATECPECHEVNCPTLVSAWSLQ